MKNQYFGDTRDLFKYDLALRFMSGVPSLCSFTFVPMLTPDDGSGEGGRTGYGKAAAGSRNRALRRHLAEAVREGRRDIREITLFFREQGYGIHLHEPGFTHGDRAAYFRSIPRPWLRDALVLLDPDIGLEVARPTEKHLLFAEAGELLGRMKGSSVLMIFQYFPRVHRAPYLAKRIGELRGIAPQGVTAIADSRVAFFFAGWDQGTMEKVRQVLAAYHDEYPALILAP